MGYCHHTFTPSQQAVLVEFFKTADTLTFNSSPSRESSPHIPVPCNWLSNDQQARLCGLPGTSLYDDAKKHLDSLLDTPRQWNTKNNLTLYELKDVIRYMVIFTAYKKDGGNRHFLQNISDTAIFGLKAALTHIKPISSWSSDDDEQFISAIIHYARGSQVAKQLTAAEIMENLSIFTINDKYDHPAVLKLQARTAQALHDYSDTFSDIGIQNQIDLLIKASWPLHFQEMLKSRISHLKEWNLVWVKFNALVSEFHTSQIIEDLRKRLLPQATAIIAARSKTAGDKSTDTTPAKAKNDMLEYSEYSANTAAALSHKSSSRTSPTEIDPTIDCGNCINLNHYKRHSALKCTRHCKDPKCKSEPDHLHKVCPQHPLKLSKIASANHVKTITMPPYTMDAASLRRANKLTRQSPIKKDTNVRYFYDKHGQLEIDYDVANDSDHSHDYDAEEDD